MTTTIPSVITNRTLLFHGSNDLEGPVSFEVVGHGSDSPVVLANRDAFLDAVRTELGVLIIDKADLPEVVQDDVGDVYVNGLRYSDDLEAHREAALRHFAIAAHLEAPPPVDEQQVEQIWNALTEVGMDDADGPTPHLVATRLATAGYRIEKVQS